MIFTQRFFASLILCGLITACSVLDAPSVEIPTLPATETPLQTPTIVWFPASATPSPEAFATATATPEMRPGLGNTTLSDSFTDGTLWDTAASDQGSASVVNNHLTLAAQSKVYIISLRHKLSLNNFYAEITAQPNLCRGDDDYGLLIRANAVAYYRFSLTCNGMVYAERVRFKNSQLLHESIASGDVPIGPPGEVRIGVWAVGTEMRLFINGHYQFSINDASYASGTIGVFARSAGDTPVVVNFTDLVVQDVTFSPPTRTPLP